MKRGLDTNVLVYAHIASFPQHARVRSYLLDQLADETTTLAIAPSILHEFIHVVTDSRRFDQAATMSQALEIARIYLQQENVAYLEPSEAIMLEAFDLMERFGLGRRRLADTLFAATLLHHGVRQIVTCNRRDFEIFEGLEILDPCQES